MPELRFRLRWPDGSEETCYSPSTIVREYFEEGKSYSIQKFKEVSNAALNKASDRVAATYGYRCANALRQLAQIEMRLKNFEKQEGAKVTFIRYEG